MVMPTCCANGSMDGSASRSSGCPTVLSERSRCAQPAASSRTSAASRSAGARSSRGRLRGPGTQLPHPRAVARGGQDRRQPLGGDVFRTAWASGRAASAGHWPANPARSATQPGFVSHIATQIFTFVAISSRRSASRVVGGRPSSVVKVGSTAANSFTRLAAKMPRSTSAADSGTPCSARLAR